MVETERGGRLQAAQAALGTRRRPLQTLQEQLGHAGRHRGCRKCYRCQPEVFLCRSAAKGGAILSAAGGASRGAVERKEAAG